uniref:Uncharacterized protein n=1 Tax=Human betaherpesvirus 6 TaxID=10368 RepID=A0A5P9U8P6_9BETA|nr:hypothetical protein [Human betaherpesvirus 6]
MLGRIINSLCIVLMISATCFDLVKYIMMAPVLEHPLEQMLYTASFSLFSGKGFLGICLYSNARMVFLKSFLKSFVDTLPR